MRFSSLASGNLLTHRSINEGDEKSDIKSICDNNSSLESRTEPVEVGAETNKNNNNSMMSDNFNNWNISARNEIASGLMKLNKKAFTVLCEPDSENNENREIKQVPSAR